MPISVIHRRKALSVFLLVQVSWIMFQMAHYIQKCQNNLLDILEEKQSSQEKEFDIVP